MSTKQLQIVTPIVTSVNGKSGDVTVSGGFLCTITGSGTTADPYQCNKTYQEVLDAVDNGDLPICVYPTTSDTHGYGDKKLLLEYQEYICTPSSEYIIFRNSFFNAVNDSFYDYILYLYSNEKVEISALNEQAATRKWIKNMGYLTEHQSLDNYALKTDVQVITSAIPKISVSNHTLIMSRT